MMSSSRHTTLSDHPAVIAGNSGRPVRVFLITEINHADVILVSCDHSSGDVAHGVCGTALVDSAAQVAVNLKKIRLSGHAAAVAAARTVGSLSLPSRQFPDSLPIHQGSRSAIPECSYRLQEVLGVEAGFVVFAQRFALSHTSCLAWNFFCSPIV
jgi:hypothetical protein